MTVMHHRHLSTHVAGGTTITTTAAAAAAATTTTTPAGAPAIHRDDVAGAAVWIWMQGGENPDDGVHQPGPGTWNWS